MNLALGGSRVLSWRAHVRPANRSVTLFCLRNLKSSLGFGAVGADPDVTSPDRAQGTLACCCGGCGQVTDPDGWKKILAGGISHTEPFLTAVKTAMNAGDERY